MNHGLYCCSMVADDVRRKHALRIQPCALNPFSAIHGLFLEDNHVEGLGFRV